MEHTGWILVSVAAKMMGYQIRTLFATATVEREPVKIWS